MPSINYTELVDALAELLVTPSDSTEFLAFLPRIIDYAEGRIYREIDFLATREVNSALPFTAGQREFTLPTGTLVMEKIAAISPSGTTVATGTRNPIQMMDITVLDYIWPQSDSSQGIPLYGARKDATTVVVAPTPDAAYIAEVTGIFRPEVISASNPETYLSTTYPDLLIAACMVMGTGYQQNFSAQSDNPEMSQSWENQYRVLSKSVFEEEQRRKGVSSGWTPYAPAPLATPPRS